MIYHYYKCVEITFSEIEKQGASVADAKAKCKSEGGQFYDKCPGNYDVRCYKEAKEKYFYYYGDEIKGLACGDF